MHPGSCVEFRRVNGSLALEQLLILICCYNVRAQLSLTILPSQENHRPSSEAVLSPGLIWLLAIACGTTVANLYYIQPLLAQMAAYWHTSESTMGSIAALLMCGYGSGILLFVPLGDIFERRRLILLFLVLITVALIVIGFAPNLTLLAVAAYLLGAITITPQLIIPFATGLAEPERRGAVVGKLMAGLLTGILLSRTLGGIVGAHFGWRAVFWCAAALNTVLLVAMSLSLPKSSLSAGLNYPKLLRSIFEIATTERIVQTSAFFGAMTFGSFNVFWTTLSFFASGNPYHYSTEIIGLFGVIGATGALAAPLAGRLADSRGPMFGIGLSLCLVILSYIELFCFGSNLFGLILGIVVLDLAVHSSQVSNMARIYSLSPSMYNRLNTIYMVSYFIGGSLGAWLGALAWSRWGWPGVCITGGAFSVIGLLMYVFVSLNQKAKTR